jgi:hypothetical protein
MIPILEKQFEFTSALTIDECVVRLQDQRTVRKNLLDAPDRVTVQVVDYSSGKRFLIGRDVGKNLYAEVEGELRRNPEGSVHVSAVGRVLISTMLFMIGVSLVVVWIDSQLLKSGVFSLIVIGANLLLLMMIFNNRNNLIWIVQQALNAPLN